MKVRTMYKVGVYRWNGEGRERRPHYVAGTPEGGMDDWVISSLPKQALPLTRDEVKRFVSSSYTDVKGYELFIIPITMQVSD